MQTQSYEPQKLFHYWNNRLKNFLSDENNSKTVPIKLLQKLQILEKSINHENISLQDYLNMDEWEVQRLVQQQDDIKINLFMSIAKVFLKDDVVGRIDVRGDSKITWNQKELIIDPNSKTLQIQKKSKPDEYHTLNLSNYKVKWLKGAQRKYQFELQLVITKDQTKFKNVMFGDDDFENAKQLFEHIKGCCYSYEDESLSKEKLKKSTTDVKQQHQNEEEAREKKQYKSYIAPPSDDPRDRNAFVSQPKSMIQATKAGSPQNREEQSQSEKPEKQIQSQQFQKQEDNRSEIAKNQTYEKVEIKKQEAKQSEVVDGHSESDSKSKTEYQQSHKQHQSKPQSEASQEDSQTSTPKKVVQSVPTLPIKKQPIRKVPAIYDEMIKYEVTSKANLLQDSGFQLMHFQKNLRILQNSENPLNFKVFLIVECFEPIQIIQSLVNADELLKWNQQVDSKSKNIQIIPDQSVVVLYEKRKKYGRLYRDRDFVIMKHVMKVDEEYYILEKSVTHEEFKPSMSVVRGEIIWGVWGIFVDQAKKSSMLVYNVFQKNEGYSSAHQDAEITTSYLLQFEKLEQYLKQLNYFQIGGQQQKVPRYLTNIFEAEAQDPIEDIEDQLTSIMNQAQAQQQVIQANDQQSEHKSDRAPSSESDEHHRLDQEFRDEDGQQLTNFAKQAILSSKKDDETNTEFLQRLLLQVERNPESICEAAIHYYELSPVDTEEKFNVPRPGHHFIFKDDWVVDEKNGGMKFINKRKIELQKEMIKFLLKKIGTNLFKGQSLMSISLPVYIFEKRSNLERHAYQFTYASRFLDAAAQKTDPLEQMRETIKLGTSACMMYVSMEKPFNPILGETFQGRINGCPVYCEQVSHHPPICALQMYGRGWKMHGHMEIIANLSANSVAGENVGYLQVEFENTKSTIKFNIPTGYISGINYGDRMCYVDGVQWYVDVKNLIMGELIMTTSTSMFSKRVNPLDWVDGKIYKINEKEVEKFQREGYKKYQGTKGTKYEVIGEVNGRYTSRVQVAPDNFLDYSIHFPHLLELETNPLASDGVYREDLIAWKLDDFDLAQARKEKLEIVQRGDRKLRERLGPKKKHH